LICKQFCFSRILARCYYISANLFRRRSPQSHMLLEVPRSLAITLFLTCVSRFCRIQLAVTIDSKQPFEPGLEITPKITVNLVYVARQPCSLVVALRLPSPVSSK